MMRVRVLGGIALAVVVALAAYAGLQMTQTEPQPDSGPQALPLPQALPPLQAPPQASGVAAYPEGWGQCVNGEDGYSIGLPKGWVATAEGLEDPCSLFNPEPFEIEPGAPLAAAMVVGELPVSFDEAVIEVTESGGPEPERVEFFALDAMRFEVVDEDHPVWPDGTRRYGYLFDRGGDGFIVQTVALPGEDADYEANRKIIDQAAPTLEFVEVRVAAAPKPKRQSPVAPGEKATSTEPPATVVAAEGSEPAPSSAEPAPSEPAPSSEPRRSDGSGGSSRPDRSRQPETTRLTLTARSASSGQFSDQTLLKARLTDSGGNALGGRELTFKLASEESSRTFTATTNRNGVASVTPILEESPGSYRLTVRFRASDHHEASSDGKDFTVEKEDTATELAVEGEGEDRTLTARLSDLDTQERGVEGRTIRFFADGEFIGSNVTDEEGVAILEAPPGYRGGHHEFEARFDGDDFYLGSSARAAS